MEATTKTNPFQEVIRAYLNGRAATDPTFGLKAKKEGKSIEKCCDYIINQVKASGRQGFDDEEIYGMAVHYYDEDNIEVKPAPRCRIVVNHAVAKPQTAAQVAQKQDPNQLTLFDSLL